MYQVAELAAEHSRSTLQRAEQLGLAPAAGAAPGAPDGGQGRAPPVRGVAPGGRTARHVRVGGLLKGISAQFTRFLAQDFQHRISSTGGARAGASGQPAHTAYAGGTSPRMAETMLSARRVSRTHGPRNARAPSHAATAAVARLPARSCSGSDVGPTPAGSYRVRQRPGTGHADQHALRLDAGRCHPRGQVQWAGHRGIRLGRHLSQPPARAIQQTGARGAEPGARRAGRPGHLERPVLTPMISSGSVSRTAATRSATRLISPLGLAGPGDASTTTSAPSAAAVRTRPIAAAGSVAAAGSTTAMTTSSPARTSGAPAAGHSWAARPQTRP